MVIAIVLTVAYVSFVVLRLVAGSRLSPPRASTIWLLFTPRLFIPVALIVVSATVITTRPVVGLFLALVGLGHGALVIRMIRRVARAAASATTMEDVANAAIEPSADFMLTTMAIGLVGLIVIGLVAIVWAVATGGR
jgi:hypothetical protein